MSLKNNTNHENARRMAPSQGGHEPWVLPSCMAHLPRMPLYLTVAWWGLHLGRPFTRHDVSRAFHITPRRASGMMAYIAHRCGTRVESEFILRATGPCQGQMVLKVYSVDNRQALPARAAASRQAGRTSAQANEPARRQQEQQARQRELAQWVLSRPRGNAAALAAWQARCPVGRDAC